ncbi:GTP cyclohydrolase 1 type 2 [Rubripirellula amarantea]|uniref:GTP cyclohydrolase 1 type 2 homolog n=1 Tax=Rubripirellula amarantea TaxID=2527999 RepID=A0A5C5WXW8_9BACT|nr:Nif3-like dinuclear metal center hexameric protein [Rubripirellula amarantea]TWT54722.1 GTP cyclohydrolase 1 type 2 [Rubripirellula amarantea]
MCAGAIPGLPLETICSTLTQIAPLRLAEDWDNVGLLAGDRKVIVSRVMTCLTITPDVVDEAIESRVGLIVAHHPLPFKPLGKITTDTVAGEMLWRLLGARIAIYSAHTAFDSAAVGINQRWADLLELQSVEPLVPSDALVGTKREGAGRLGHLPAPVSMKELTVRAADMVGASAPRMVGGEERLVKRIGIACGSGGSFLAAAKRRGCEALITGEATFHTCLEARSMGIGLAMMGHYASERFAMEWLATRMADELDGIEVWASRNESDPVVRV